MYFSIIVLSLLSTQAVTSAPWWGYDGIAGPSHWGLLSPEWEMCGKGKRQSPINIESDKLLFDPLLGDLQVSNKDVNGVLLNTGQHLVFKIGSDTEGVTVTGGPLPYYYKLEKITIHYGPNDTVGSEHQINGKLFPGEIQFYAYNIDLYRNMSEAQQKPHGVAVMSAMVRVGEPSPELRLITSSWTKVVYKNSSHHVTNLNISSLLPNTREYLTYEGSTTEPGCWESAMWIIYNKPIYISVQQMYAIRKLMQGTEDTPKCPLTGNARPVQPSQLTVRTNIKSRSTTHADDCSNRYTEITRSDNGGEGDLPLISPKQ